MADGLCAHGGPRGLCREFGGGVFISLLREAAGLDSGHGGCERDPTLDGDLDWLFDFH